jgi:hypothetical protein
VSPERQLHHRNDHQLFFGIGHQGWTITL